MVVKGLGPVAAPAGTGPVGAGPAGAGRGAGPSGFSVSVGANPAVAMTPGVAALDGLLLLQEVEGAPERDRRARKHGRAMLDALSRLQLGLLDADGGADALANLSALAEHCPEAADPGLRDLLGAVSLRARVELARRGL